jgi:aspartate/methionine/tyrosine aminotransferase
VASDYARRGAAVDPAAIVLAGSTSEAYGWLFALLGNPGDTVLVPEPSYPLFEYLARLAGVRPRPYRLVLDGRWALDVDSLRAAARAARVRAVVVVAPNNPTGSVPDAEEWRALQTVCQDVGAALIVDEVFADYGPEGPATAAARPLPVLTVTLGGLSKSAGLPQLKVAWLGFHGPPTVVAAALGAVDLIADTYLPVPGPIQHAVPGLLDLGAGVRARIQARVRVNRDHLAALLGPASAASLLPGPGAWSAIVRVPAVRGDEAWALGLLEDAGVLVHPGYFFDLAGGDHLVPSVLAEPAVFTEGIQRLVIAVEAAARA